MFSVHTGGERQRLMLLLRLSHTPRLEVKDERLLRHKHSAGKLFGSVVAGIMLNVIISGGRSLEFQHVRNLGRREVPSAISPVPTRESGSRRMSIPRVKPSVELFPPPSMWRIYCTCLCPADGTRPEANF